MKTVRVKENVVIEIIPEYALPVENWYSVAFAAECMEAPDEVEQDWTYNPESGEFSAPVEPAPEPIPSADVTTSEMAAAITEGVNSI